MLSADLDVHRCIKLSPKNDFSYLYINDTALSMSTKVDIVLTYPQLVFKLENKKDFFLENLSPFYLLYGLGYWRRGSVIWPFTGDMVA